MAIHVKMSKLLSGTALAGSLHRRAAGYLPSGRTLRRGGLLVAICGALASCSGVQPSPDTSYQGNGWYGEAPRYQDDPPPQYAPPAYALNNQPQGGSFDPSRPSSNHLGDMAAGGALGAVGGMMAGRMSGGAAAAEAGGAEAAAGVGAGEGAAAGAGESAAAGEVGTVARGALAAPEVVEGAELGTIMEEIGTVIVEDWWLLLPVTEDHDAEAALWQAAGNGARTRR